MSTTTYTWTEVAAHASRDSFWMVIDGKVYDVTKFLDEHPGGEEVMLEQAGVDATEAFEEIGHSEDARDLLKGMLIGTIESKKPAPAAAAAPASASTGTKVAAASTKKDSGTVIKILIPLAVFAAFFAYKWMH